jgi:uncharacterized protein (DUF2249 family)
MSMNTSTFPLCVDVRRVVPRDRHPLIFSTFRALGVGEAMELVNDHDPKPLYFQFNAEAPGQFTWDYLERGPETWRVRIERLAMSHGAGQCCGHCGGA